MNQVKMKNISIKGTGQKIRVAESIADEMVKTGEASYCSKGAVKHWWNTFDKLESNRKRLGLTKETENLSKSVFYPDFSKNQKAPENEQNFIYEDKSNGKTYAYVHQKTVQRVEKVKELNPKVEELPWWKKAVNAVSKVFTDKDVFDPIKGRITVVETEKEKTYTIPKYTRYVVSVK